MTLNGSEVGAGVLPVVNPNLNLNDYSFNVVKVDISVLTLLSSVLVLHFLEPNFQSS